MIHNGGDLWLLAASATAPVREVTWIFVRLPSTEAAPFSDGEADY
jgi:hypothetical protein